ncbi:M48 family metalloprotease [Nocardiopsis sp. CNR-923]|uniref:M48 family metalloprotease n=1 Tax=Nocardiopsis sp. CNR-923 TaxID=1904965 RepID=UPI00096A9ED7|nr:M48 family metalloprotease [Nocardiopsis sp. CNR-923]
MSKRYPTEQRERDLLASMVAALAVVTMSLPSLAWLLPSANDADRTLPTRDNSSVLSGIFLLLLAPLAALVIHVGVGQRRKFHADEEAARLTSDPLSLASALRKIEEGGRTYQLSTEGPLLAIGHMMTVNPFPKIGIRRLFDTHPPIPKRIRRLLRLNAQFNQ